MARKPYFSFEFEFAFLLSLSSRPFDFRKSSGSDSVAPLWASCLKLSVKSVLCWEFTWLGLEIAKGICIYIYILFWGGFWREKVRCLVSLMIHTGFV